MFKKYRTYLVNYNISIVALQSLKQKNSKFNALVTVGIFNFPIFLIPFSYLATPIAISKSTNENFKIEP